MADAGASGDPDSASHSATQNADQYEWVHDSASQRSLIRRHTMKTSWRKRFQLSNAQKVNKNTTRELRPLLHGPISDEVKTPRTGDIPIKAQLKVGNKPHARNLEVNKGGDNELHVAVSDSAASGVGEVWQPEEQGIQQLAIRSSGRVIPRTRTKTNVVMRYGSGVAVRRTALIVSSPKVHFVDPFSTTSIELEHREQSLLYWWLGPQCTMMFGQNSRPAEENRVKQVHGGLFDIPGAFHAALSYAAIHRGHHTGEDWIVASTYHKSEALSLINKQLDIPELATNDTAIYTVVWLLTLEDWWGSREVYNVHLKGLERMISLRGGSESLRSDWNLEVNYLGLRLCSRPRWFDTPLTSSPPAEPLRVITVHQPPATLWESCHELFNYCQEFSNFFLEIQSLHQATLTQPCRPSTSSHPYICEVIEIIRSPINEDADVRPPFQSCVGETISVVILFYLTVVWRDQILSPEPQTDLLRSLDDGLRDNAYRWRSAFGMLFFCMHSIESYNLGHTDRFHSVLGLMDVTRHLPWKSWLEVRTALQDVLLGNNSGGSAWSELCDVSLVEALVR